MPFNSVSLLDISPDRSQLLTVDFAGTEAESQFWGLPLPSGMPRRIEGVVGHDGSWSRDGRHLVFARGSDINVANADGSDIHRLLSVGGRPFALRFSPNGTLIRFSVLNTQTNSSSISEIRTTGTSLRSLLPGSSGLLWACCGDWTADGRYYIFESGSYSRFDVWEFPERSGLRSESSTPVPLTT